MQPRILLAPCVIAALLAGGRTTSAEELMGPPIPYRHTSIKSEACQPPPPKQRAAFEQREVGAKQCPAVDDWQLFLAFTEDASWLELARGGSLWSTREQVAGASRIGIAPNIASDGVEWLPPQGAATTLIFHLEAREPATANGAGKRIARIGVLSLEGEAPRFCGLAKSSEEAKLMAERRDSCREPLQPFPWRQ